MYRNLRNGAALVLLAAAALATWYFARPAKNPAPAVQESGSYPLGYYLRDATLLGTDEQGRILYRLHAKLAEERPDNGGLLLHDVKFEYQPAEHVPWNVTAARGEAPAAQPSYLDLEGNVEITRNPGAEGGTARVETNRLRLEPEQRMASTSGPVRISVGGNTLDAVGLKAFLGSDRIELESKVHGRFTP